MRVLLVLIGALVYGILSGPTANMADAAPLVSASKAAAEYILKSTENDV